MRRLAHRERTAATEGPLRRVWRVLWLAAYHFRKDNGFVFAGHIAYMAMFSIFPFLIFILALAGAVGQGDAMRQAVELGLTFLPPDVAASLRPAIDEVRDAPHAGLMSVSALVTIWTSSSGIETLRHVLNLAYDVADPPSIVRSRLESMGLTVLAAIVVLCSTVLLVVMPLALDVTNLFLRQRFELAELLRLAALPARHRAPPPAPHGALPPAAERQAAAPRDRARRAPGLEHLGDARTKPTPSTSATCRATASPTAAWAGSSSRCSSSTSPRCCSSSAPRSTAC